MEITLKQRYESIAEEYRVAMIRQSYSNEEVPYVDSYWVANEIGDVLELNEDFFDFDTIRYIVDNNIQYETWYNWFQYCQSVGNFGISTPNLKAWCKGCPRLSDEKIERLVKLKQDLQDQIEDDKQYLKGGF